MTALPDVCVLVHRECRAGKELRIYGAAASACAAEAEATRCRVCTYGGEACSPSMVMQS